ncbi:MAG: hypothetical protein LQ338_008314, partial [Usnochroma carphineum]
FFITLAPCEHLNAKHTVFGHVVRGMDVCERMAKLPVDSKDRPLSEVIVSHCGELERRPKPSTGPQTPIAKQKRARHRSQEKVEAANNDLHLYAGEVIWGLMKTAAVVTQHGPFLHRVSPPNRHLNTAVIAGVVRHPRVLGLQGDQDRHTFDVDPRIERNHLDTVTNLTNVTDTTRIIIESRDRKEKTMKSVMKAITEDGFIGTSTGEYRDWSVG